MSSERLSPAGGALLKRPAGLALVIAVAAAATVGTAWIYQAAGYAPCELCLKERLPYYVAIPIALATAFAAARRSRTAVLFGFGVLILCFMAGSALGLYHAGVEFGLWAGPTECSGLSAAPADVGDFFKQLDSVNVVRCDVPAIKVLGLSLAIWNALICLALLGLANAGLLGAGPPASRRP